MKSFTAALLLLTLVASCLLEVQSHVEILAENELPYEGDYENNGAALRGLTARMRELKDKDDSLAAAKQDSDPVYNRTSARAATSGGDGKYAAAFMRYRKGMKSRKCSKGSKVRWLVARCRVAVLTLAVPFLQYTSSFPGEHQNSNGFQRF
jgi:hypothetical protein